MKILHNIIYNKPERNPLNLSKFQTRLIFHISHPILSYQYAINIKPMMDEDTIFVVSTAFVITTILCPMQKTTFMVGECSRNEAHTRQTG